MDEIRAMLRAGQFKFYAMQKKLNKRLGINNGNVKRNRKTASRVSKKIKGINKDDGLGSRKDTEILKPDIVEEEKLPRD